MLTITTRLTLWYVSIIGGIIIIVAIVMYSVFEQRQKDSLDAELKDYGSFLISQVGTDNQAADEEELFDALNNITARANLRFGSMKFVVSSNENFVLDSAVQAPIDTLLNKIQFRELSLRNHKLEYQTISADETNYRIYVRPLPNQANKDLQLIVIASLEETEKVIEEFRRVLFLLVPASLLIAGLSGRFLAGRALRPVKQLTKAARQVTLGNLDQRVPTGNSSDELAQLASTFNEMIDRLKGSFTSQKNFIADASHDLRTPLTVIRAELELLLIRPDITQPVAQSINKSLKEIEKLTLLSSDMLLLAKAEAKQLDSSTQTTRLDELLVECVGDLGRLAERKGTLLLMRIEDPIEIRCDPPKLRRAFTNLVENAIEYSPDCSRVSIEMFNLGTTVQITITDNGYGILPEDLPRIFDRFYRSDRSRNTVGSGLGLAIAKAVIEAHNGTITIHSEQDTGTRVVVSLPISE